MTHHGGCSCTDDAPADNGDVETLVLAQSPSVLAIIATGVLLVARQQFHKLFG